MPHFSHSTGQYLHIEGADIYFETTGNPGGEPLVLLHGGLGTLTDFNSILPQLPVGYRLIGIDLRGHGKSTLGPLPLTYARHQADIEAVLKHLHVDSCAMLGFSDGGIAAYRMAAGQPTQIKQLITLGAQWRLLADDPSLAMLGTMTSEVWTEMFPDSVAYYNQTNPQPDFDRLVKAVVKLWTDTETTAYPGNRVGEIQSPTLVMRGDSDFLFSLDEAAELCRKIDNAHFMNIPFASHAAHLEAPDLFIGAVNHFLLHAAKKIPTV